MSQNTSGCTSTSNLTDVPIWSKAYNILKRESHLFSTLKMKILFFRLPQYNFHPFQWISNPLSVIFFWRLNNNLFWVALYSVIFGIFHGQKVISCISYFTVVHWIYQSTTPTDKSTNQQTEQFLARC